MKTLIYLLLCILPWSAQSQALSPRAQSLSDLYRQLEKDPDDVVLQNLYLLNFPHTQADFDTLFDPEDFSELYDGYMYITLFKSLVPHYPILTGCILLNIAKESRWQADAFFYLQHTTAYYALEFTPEFIDILASLNEEAQQGVIAFLADGEYAAVKEFDDIVKKISDLGEQELVERFRTINHEMQKERAVDGN